MKNIAVIPARKDSKRFPHKNRANLMGIPLIVHSFKYAKANSDILDRIIVSTNDPMIKELALENGIEVINRPKELSGDHSPTVNTLKHVLEHVNDEFNHVVLLQPTNPLRPTQLLKEAFNEYLNKNSDSLMTVSRNHHKLGKIINNKFTPYNYSMGQRSQDIDPLFYENGLLYITKTSLISKFKILGKNNLPFIVDHPFASVDIDTQEDLHYAQFILENYSNE